MEAWIHNWQDPVAGLKALPPCMCLADLKSDGDSNLIIADVQKKLRVYRGNAICWQSLLFDIPSAVAVFYSEPNSIPSLAVAIGNYIYIYKNSRPYYKFSLPSVELSSDEHRIWDSFSEQRISVHQVWQGLNELRDREIPLSSRSQELLSYDSEEEWQTYANSVKVSPLVQQTCITCLCVLKKDSDQELAASMLCVGTEHKTIYILDCTGTSLLYQVQLPGVSAYMSCSGLYLSDYRLVVACRDNKVYTIRNGSVAPAVIQLETPPSGLAVIERYVYLADTAKKLHCFHSRGKKLYTLYMPETILALTLMKLTRERVFTGLLVGLHNGEVRLYKDKALICTLESPETMLGMCFGVFGSADGCLVLNSASGGILVKRLDPKLKLEKKIEFKGPPKEQDVPLQIPTKSKLYLEQMDREKELGQSMYGGFIRDLASMRLTAARAYMEMLKLEPSNQTDQNFSVQLDAYIQGLGPLFTVYFEIFNAGKEVCEGVRLAVNHGEGVKLLKTTEVFPVLLPGLKYRGDLPIENVKGSSETLRLFLSNQASNLPLISALVSVPACEIYLE